MTYLALYAIVTTLVLSVWAWRALFRGWKHGHDRRTALARSCRRSWRHVNDRWQAAAARFLRDIAEVLHPLALEQRHRRPPKRSHRDDPPEPYDASSRLAIVFGDEKR